jgi:hypothetical protein
MENNQHNYIPTEKELDAIYMYISAFWDSMEDSQKMMWIELLEKVDPEFNNTEDETD